MQQTLWQHIHICVASIHAAKSLRAEVDSSVQTSAALWHAQFFYCCCACCFMHNPHNLRTSLYSNGKRTIVIIPEYRSVSELQVRYLVPSKRLYAYVLFRGHTNGRRSIGNFLLKTRSAIRQGLHNCSPTLHRACPEELPTTILDEYKMLKLDDVKTSLFTGPDTVEKQWLVYYCDSVRL